MITVDYLDKHFYSKFFNINEETILKMNDATDDPTINNVVTGIHPHYYGLAVKDSSQSINYQLHYINGKHELVGHVLMLDINDPERDCLLIAFSRYLADTYDLDILETFNTYQEATRSMCEKLGYRTITANELFGNRDKSMSILVKNVKGVFVLPFLCHDDLYKYLFGDINPVQPDADSNFVYLMHNKRNNLVKIGKSRNPMHREKTLQAEEPEISVVAIWKADASLERHLHSLYKHKRKRGEWFKLSFSELKDIKGHVDSFLSTKHS